MSCSSACHEHINLTARGKFLLMDVEKAKRDEFNRRRKLRLQQVRQQSSEIAKEIRDRVKAEKMLKESQDDLRKKVQFEKWKESQLKNLKEEFSRRALVAEQEKENALQETELAELEKERQQVLDEISKKRGNLAMLKHRKEKLSVETESFLKTSNAKFNRSIENLRSAMIASLPKTDLKHISKDQESCHQGKQECNENVNKYTCADNISNNSKSVEGVDSVMKIISSEGQTVRRPSLNDILSNDNRDLCDMNLNSARQPKSVVTTPGKRSYAEFSRVSSRKSESGGTLTPEKSPCGEQTQSTFTSSRGFIPSKEYISKRTQQIEDNRSCSCLISSGSHQCNHSKDLSPVRCDDSYSPNKYKEVDNIGARNFKSKHVRFENVPLTDESEQFQHSICRDRSNSEGDSEASFESVSTWPPKKWNHHQDEDVILYDHCGRTTTRYQPQHTVSLINRETGGNGLEEEVEACRKKALRKHEEAVRERRGCRAMYRQQLRAEFSCMISDLANLDKQSRLAKLESDAKNALLPKKIKKSTTEGTKNEKPEKDNQNDTPGRVQVMDCIDAPVMNVDNDKKIGEEIKENALTQCNLEALDRLLLGLQEQRDYLLACQQNNEDKMDKTVQSVSVQCDELSKADCATSPRETSPNRNDRCNEEISIEGMKSRSISPIYPNQDVMNITPQAKQNSLSSTSGGRSAPHSSPLGSDSSPIHPTSHKSFSKSSKQLKEKKHKESANRISAMKEIVSTSSNNSKEESPIKVTNGSSSSMCVDATSYSFDGVKVEVKVTKNKTKRTEKRIGIKIDPTGKHKGDLIKTTEVTKNDSWAKKLSENNSSTGTSYMSPPEELNPDEHKLLISVLEVMEKKNSNPVLHMYIQRLLSMSKGSLENMTISVSDDSIRSDVFKSCEDSVKEMSQPKNSSRSFLSAISQEEITKNEVKPDSITEKVLLDRVRFILDSDDSTANKDTSVTGSTKMDIADNEISPCVPSASSETPQYLDALSHYNDRLRVLAKMMTQNVNSSKNGYSENDTAYLQIPSVIQESLRLPETAKEVSLPPEESVFDECRDDDVSKTTQPLDSVLASNLGIGLNLLPKPDSLIVKSQDKKQKPPSTINNYTTRRVLSQSVVPHELSTITEVDSKLISLYPSIKPSHSVTSDQATLNVVMPGASVLENMRSESESYHTLPPAGLLPLSSDSSFISSGSVSPVKPANESSLQIFTDLPNSSLGASSVEEMAVSEVFRSLGIGWAVSTWRKTHEASRKHHESSSSSNPSDPGAVGKKKEDRCRHSTPIKVSEAERNRRIMESEEDRLTPPSVSLYQRYQNLICSNTDSSRSGDS